MLIDWFTVGAQIVNFLILVWLFKRYLYRPLLAAIDAREKGISSRQAAATAEQEQARKDQEECKRQKETMEQQHLALVNAAKEDAKAERTKLLQAATDEAERLRVARRKELETETENYRTELTRLVRQEVVATVRKSLLDLASAELEGSSVGAFLRRLDATPLDEMVKALEPVPGAAPTPIRLRSAFALSPAQQGTATEEIQKKFHAKDRIEFETAPDLGLGFELIARDEKVAWNLDSYLAAFETCLAEYAEQKTRSVSK
jgi:F-type H+-transporting ATPase subunit b